MDAGGFDVVIGNPPYGARYTKSEAIYFNQKYIVSKGTKDVYAFFIEKVLTLLAEKGRFSFIVPSAWLGGPDYRTLRDLLLESRIDRVVLLPFDLFKDAYIDTTVFVLSNEKAREYELGTYAFGKKEKLTEIVLTEDDYFHVNAASWKEHDDRKFVLNPHSLSIMRRPNQSVKSSFSDVVVLKRGVLFDKKLLTSKKTSKSSHRYFEGMSTDMNKTLSHHTGWNLMQDEGKAEGIQMV